MPTTFEVTSIYIHQDGSFSLGLNTSGGDVDLSTLKFDENLKTFTLNGEKINLNFAENLTAIDERNQVSVITGPQQDSDFGLDYKEIAIDPSAKDLPAIFKQLNLNQPTMGSVHISLNLENGSTFTTPDVRLNPHANDFILFPNFEDGNGTIILNKGADVSQTNASKIVISPDDAEESAGVRIFKSPTINGTVLYLGNLTNVTMAPFNPEAEIIIEGTDASLRIGDLPDNDETIEKVTHKDSDHIYVERTVTNPLQEALAEALGVNEASTNLTLPNNDQVERFRKGNWR